MKGKKYIALTSYLENLDRKMVILSFDEVKRINDDYLPDSAYKYAEWWSNNPKGHTHAFGWLNAGYQTTNVNMIAQTVMFRK